jgi:hypothetical protein
LVYSSLTHDLTSILVCRYNAIRTWHKLLTSPDSEYWMQLIPGTAVGMSLHHTVNHNPCSMSGCQLSITIVSYMGGLHSMVSGACVGLISAWTITTRSSQFYRRNLLLTRFPIPPVSLMPTNVASGVPPSNLVRRQLEWTFGCTQNHHLKMSLI